MILAGLKHCFSKIGPHTELTQTLQAPQIPLPTAPRQLPALTLLDLMGPPAPRYTSPWWCLMISPYKRNREIHWNNFLLPQQVQFRLRSYVYVPLGAIIEAPACLRAKKPKSSYEHTLKQCTDSLLSPPSFQKVLVSSHCGTKTNALNHNIFHKPEFLAVWPALVDQYQAFLSSSALAFPFQLPPPHPTHQGE